MTTSQRPALEQAAREFVETLLARELCLSDAECTIVQEATVALLAAQWKAVLEGVANEMARHPYWSKEAEVWIKHLRQAAQEGRP